MSSNPTTQKQLLYSKKSQQQQNVSSEMGKSMVIQNSQYSAVEENPIQAKDLSSIYSHIAESISQNELKTLISYLKHKQENENRTLPNVERKQKTYQLLTRKDILSKYPTAEEITKTRHKQMQEDLNKNIDILGDSVLEFNIEESHGKPQQSSSENKNNLTTSEKVIREQLRENQLQEQEDVYGSMSILGETILEYDLAEVPYATHNKPRKQSSKKREELTHDQKEEREQLRQLQLQDQEFLYENIDLLGETVQDFKLLQPDTESNKSVENNISHGQTIISIPSDLTTPDTSSGSRRISKYLSPEQIAQLAKIRKERYEQQDREYSEGELLGDSVPFGLKSVYSFRQPNARLKSPRELVFKKSIANVKKNKDQYSKALPLPVINFPPSNWPTPVVPEVRLDLDRLREEQRQYFLSMQHAQAQKFQNQYQDQEQSILQSQDVKLTQNQREYTTQDHQKYQRNLRNTNSSGNIYSDHHNLLKYLYIILFVQWSIIILMASLFKYHDPSSLWLKETGKWTWLYILCLLNVLIVGFMILPFTRYYFPVNLVMLSVFTILVAFMFSFVEIYYPNDGVLLALSCACGICVVMALFFCQTSFSFKIYCGLSLCGVVILSVFGVFYFLIDFVILEMICAAIGVVLYSIYLVCNTKAIVEEKSKFQIEFDNYILGAIHMNLDFIFIIIDKFRCT